MSTLLERLSVEGISFFSGEYAEANLHDVQMESESGNILTHEKFITALNRR
jgi:hypothetical protein